MVSGARCIMRASSALGVSNEMQEVRVSSSRERAWTFGSYERDLKSERRIVEKRNEERERERERESRRWFEGEQSGWKREIERIRHRERVGLERLG